MSVSLVKITPTTVVYVVGYAYGPYLPASDNLTVCTTIDAARDALAYELERAEDSAYQAMGEDDDYSDANSIGATAEMVKADRDGDITWNVANRDGWATGEADGYTYWIHASTLGTVFGDDTESEEYLDVVDALLS